MDFSTAGILSAAAASLEIRSEVESVMSSMLTDVESTIHLQNEYETQKEIQSLKNKLKHSSAALEEYHSFRLSEQSRRQEIGDLFVGELLLLSLKLGDLEMWKAENESKINKFNELEDKLARSEEMVRNMQRNRSLNANWDKDLTVTEQEQTDQTHDNTTKQNVNSKNIPQEYNTTTTTTPTTTITNNNNNNNNNNTNLQEVETTTIEEKDNTPIISDDNDTSGPDAAAGEMVSNNEISTDSTSFMDLVETPSLQNIDEKTLMNLFEFLDAFDILNISLVNITLYSKIDALFGLGGVVTSQRSTDTSAAANDNTSNQVTSNSTPSTNAVPKSNTATSSTTGVPSSQVAKGTESATSNNDGNSIPTTSSLIQNVRVGSFPSVFNLLKKGEDGDESTTIIANNPINTIFQKRPPAAASSGSEMTPSMANSLSDKLSPAELSAIISIKSKLQEKSKQLEILKIEKEDLAARLESSESVKEFLINKVRDTENECKKSKDECKKMTDKVSSDQEVIAFLDGRVQDLEKSIHGFEEGKRNAEKECKQMKESTDKKIEVLSDMLQFERETLSGNEKEWKSTKKVLVKEVKHCRAQILTLQAERDSFHQQNKQLKEALLSLSNNSSSSRNDRSF